ncbi:MAG: hypothetical protein OFPI_23970 [Osedax symbiont Rs2]|nr:MAG: hypothetical protein OFPI_23970 [Osedax symbiont Rs2]
MAVVRSLVVSQKQCGYLTAIISVLISLNAFNRFILSLTL